MMTPVAFLITLCMRLYNPDTRRPRLDWVTPGAAIGVMTLPPISGSAPFASVAYLSGWKRSSWKRRRAHER